MGVRFVFVPKFVVFAALFATAGVAAESHSFSNFEIGDTIPQAKLPTLAGKVAPLVDPKQKISVFFFVRPGQENSETVLEEIAKCETEFADRPVHWVGIVSDYYPKADSQAMVKKSGVKAPILIDKGDALYGKLGVRLHPVIGIASGDNKLLAYQPFRRINYCALVRARVQHALGDIDDAQLQAVLEPPKATQGGDVAVAKRNLKFAAMMRKAKKLDKALELAQKAIETAPEFAPAHAMVGDILAEQKKCEAAKPHLEKALSLDAEDEMAKAGMGTCGFGPAPEKAAAPEATPEPEKDAAPEATPEPEKDAAPEATPEPEKKATKAE
ncbi:MAG: redoxin domain-containing protein [Deltaproteobacteria bacterium]|nr:redoxin domain-containing protein [Deltaproteobacteria bacterium]